MSDKSRRVLAVLGVLAVTLCGLAAAKSLYVIAHHDGTYSAYNINPDGSVSWQANYPSGAWGPAGMALHDDSATLFVTYEFSGNVVLVDAVTMLGLGSVPAPGASDLAGIDVDDINSVVYAVDRWTDNLYGYDWDGTNLSLKAGFPVDLVGCVWPEGAFGIAVDEIAGKLYLSCSSGGPWGGSWSGSVQVYDMGTWTEDFRFHPVIPPVGIAVDRVRRVVYTTAPTTGCANAPSGFTKLSRYDLATGVESWFDMGHGGMGLVVDELTGYLYVTGGCDGDDLSVWDPTTWNMMQTTGYIGSPAGLATGNVSYNPLNLTKDDGLGEDGCAVPGWSIAYELCVDNSPNPFEVTGVLLVDDLPTEVGFVSASAGGSYDGGTHTVSWNLGTLAANAGPVCVDLVVALPITATPESVFTNQVTITSDQTPPTTIEEETHVCPIIPVPFDVKPNSCRNPLQIRGGGVLPGAVLGTPDFDVTWIDPASLTLEGVAALRWALEDVETPYEPYLGKSDAFDCAAIGPDGWLDLTLKFDKRAIVEALGDVDDGEVVVLTLSGNLLPEHGGMQILGEDVVVILK